MNIFPYFDDPLKTLQFCFLICLWFTWNWFLHMLLIFPNRYPVVSALLAIKSILSPLIGSLPLPCILCTICTGLFLGPCSVPVAYSSILSTNTALNYHFGFIVSLDKWPGLMIWSGTSLTNICWPQRRFYESVWCGCGCGCCAVVWWGLGKCQTHICMWWRCVCWGCLFLWLILKIFK